LKADASVTTLNPTGAGVYTPGTRSCADDAADVRRRTASTSGTHPAHIFNSD
jgi:hypothetical protein